MRLTICAIFMLSVGCASDWKVHGGPKECVQMCKDWNMDLTAMVGVGDQSRSGGGATACVCQPRKRDKTGDMGSGAATSIGGPVTAAEAAHAAAMAAQQAHIRQHRSPTH